MMLYPTLNLLYIYIYYIASLARPRTYPQGFADELKTLYPGLVSGAEGMPCTDKNVSPQKAFENQAWSTWEEAKLLGTLRYLRGNRHLNPPQEWLDAFPTPFEVLHRMEMRHQSLANQ